MKLHSMWSVANPIGRRNDKIRWQCDVSDAQGETHFNSYMYAYAYVLDLICMEQQEIIATRAI